MSALKLTLFTFLAVAFTYNPIFCAEGSGDNAGAAGNNNAGGAPAPTGQANATPSQIPAPVAEYNATNFRQAVIKTDVEVNKLVYTLADALSAKFNAQYNTYIAKVTGEGSAEYAKESKEMVAGFTTKIKTFVDILKNTTDNWQTNVDDVVNTLGEFSAYILTVYEKAHSMLEGDNATNLTYELNKNKADNFNHILTLYHNIVKKFADEVYTCGAVNEAIRAAVIEAATKFAELKNETDSLVVKITTEDREHGSDYLADLVSRKSELFQQATIVQNKAIENRDEKQIEYMKEIQYGLFSMIADGVDFSRSVIPGFFAIALSFFMVVL
uniref:Merozoite surface protein 3 n=1 Tax=Babesia rodhaini TaxID=5870 RepID=Q17279_BABRO|nr:surface antigen 17 [Babesia rodhaini]BAE06231.1 merozoite surface protein 3 [Babesia rodhaini]BBD96209.1 merozoite surface protein 3 [Babesia rodhaini]prf//1413319B surface membrane protein 2 [Babesia rodhaini]